MRMTQAGHEMLTPVPGRRLSAALARAGRWRVSAHGPGLRCAAVIVLLLGISPPDLRSSPGPSPVAVFQRPDEPIRPLAPPQAQDPARVALGRALFKDTRLSHNGSRACASCHDTATNGADARSRDTGPDGRVDSRNTNTVFNAALSFRLDWIGDVRTLEEQADASLRNAARMATTPQEVIGKLNADDAMVRSFQAAYGRPPEWSTLLDALATYERTLVTPDSRFDQWLAGHDDALTAEELAGYRLFKSAGCVSCHQGANVGGNLYERNGIFRPLLPSGIGMMRVPSLRNVAVTPPYFHDGSIVELGDAVQDMAEAQLGRTFTEPELRQIVAFLGSLTGRYEGHLLRKPTP